MNKTELLEIFRTFTKEDWEIMENIKGEQYKETAEEIIEREQQQIGYKQQVIISKMEALGIEVPDIITKEFVLGILRIIKAEQWVGKDLDKWIDNQIALFGDIENAFNEIVFTHLNV